MYQIYLGRLALPVAPSKLQMDVKNRNETIELIDGAEVNLLKRPGLTDIKFDALIPASPYPFAFYENGFLEPRYFLDHFENLKNSRKPFPFKVIRKRFNGRGYFDTETMDVSLETYSIQENSDNGLDLILSVSLKQYAPFGTEIVSIVEEKKDGNVILSETKQRPAKPAAKSHTVKKGENLWKICQKELGSGEACWQVAKNNGIANPNKIYPGQVIRLE